MNGFQQLTIVILGAVFFRLGGEYWKPYRWYLMPALWALQYLGAGIYWQALALVPFAAALHIAYGETKPYWYKLMSASAWFVPSLVFGFSWWQVFTPLLFVGLFALSNWHKTERIFVWERVEIITGALLGITYCWRA